MGYQKFGNIYMRIPAKVTASYNAASQSEESQRNYAGSDFLSADYSMQQDKRRLISSRARNEFANNSFAYGIVSTLADDTIGRGPRLQLDVFDDGGELDDSAEGSLQRRERRFAKWSNDVGFVSLLRCARIAKAVDGEVFIRLNQNPGAERENQLEPVLYEHEYVASPDFNQIPSNFYKTGVPVELDGIEFDQYGNVQFYRFWRVHPGSMVGVASTDSQRIPKKYVLHYANIFRPGQHRGLCEMVAALPIFNDLRRYSTAVVLAAEVAARLSFIVSNDLPPEMYESTVEMSSNGRLERDALDLRNYGQICDGDFNSLVLPAGYHASQLKSEQPTQSYVAFRDSKINEAARVFSMPFNVAAGNSSSYNYASGRLDHQVYHKRLLIERQHISNVIMNPVYYAWEEQDRLIHPEDYDDAIDTSVEWMWDGFEHVDPVKEANAQAARLANGVTDIFDECAKEGRDALSLLRSRKRTLKMCEKMGLNLPWLNPSSMTMVDDNNNSNQ